MPIAQETVFLGANTKTHRRFLPEGVGRASLNQKPSEEGDFRPWRVPLAISGPVIPSGRTTIYRLGQDTASSTDFWLSWTTIVHAIRGFDASDPTERTYFTGSGVEQDRGSVGEPALVDSREVARLSGAGAQQRHDEGQESGQHGMLSLGWISLTSASRAARRWASIPRSTPCFFL